MTQVQTDPALQADWPTRSAGQPPSRRSPFAFLRELPALLVMAFGIALLLKTFLVQAFFIPSESMLPTLEKDDRVLVNKLAYRFREPRRGEVIVFIAERQEEDRSTVQQVIDFLVEGLGVAAPRGERDFIKRIIGLPGEKIQVTTKGVFITPVGAEKSFKLREPYIFDAEIQGPTQEKITVPEDTFFVMGDNRGNSSDSRSQLGPVARADIIGKAFVRIWPPKRLGNLDPPSYDRPPPADQLEAVPLHEPPALPVPVLALGLATGIRSRRILRRLRP